MGHLSNVKQLIYILAISRRNRIKLHYTIIVQSNYKYTFSLMTPNTPDNSMPMWGGAVCWAI